MPAVHRFPRRDQRGRLRPGLLLTPERLSIWHGRKPRHLSWSEVLCVRWLDREHAELVLVGDDTVPLGQIEQLGEAVAAIDRRVEQARMAAATADSVPNALAKRLLRPRPLAWPTAVLCAVVFGLLAYLFASEQRGGGGGFDFRAWRWWIALAGAVGGVGLVWGWRQGSGDVGASGVGRGSHYYAWREIRRMAKVERVIASESGYAYDVVLETIGGVVKLRLTTHADVELIRQYLADREQWRSTAYLPAGPLPPGDAALSLARQTGQDATDRGLSLTDGKGDH